MPKKQSKERQAVADYNAWLKMNEKLEKQGLVGTDYYVKRVEELEAQVELLEGMLKKERKRNK